MSSMAPAQPNPPSSNQPVGPDGQPAVLASQQNSPPATRDKNSTVRMIAMVCLIVCGLFQTMTVGGGDVLVLFAIGALLAWAILATHVAPLYILFIGNMFARLAQTSWGMGGDLFYSIFDSLTFLGLMAFGFMHYELAPKRLIDSGRTEDEPKAKRWHMLEPFSGFIVRLPIAVSAAMLLYFVSERIASPLPAQTLRTVWAQGYLTILFLFVMVIILRTVFEIWSWRNLTPGQAKFYVRNQIGTEIRDELDLLQKPAWSRIDHASAVGGMFLVQWMVAAILAIVFIVAGRFNSGYFMWPAVAAIFVFLTSLYNAIRTTRSNITSEHHLITMVSFLVILVVGFQSLRIPEWPWGMLYMTWWCFNALIIIRMSYLWLIDESYARRNNWETAKPFSLFWSAIFAAEGLFAAFVLYIVFQEMLAITLN